MKKTALVFTIVLICLSNIVSADTFGTGANQFDIDFVAISGDASTANGTNIGVGKTFSDPSNHYRIGKFEITNDQWNKFQNAYGTVTGSPLSAYDVNPYWTETNLPTNEVGWYEAAQFVNWLNVSTGHQAAYKFTGTQGQSNYTFTVWNSTDVGYNSSNPYRNSNAFYFLPTEDEWVKAGYWNGTYLQTYATPDNTYPIEDVEANFDYESGAQPWNIGSGSEELNGTFDMMGNMKEWVEGPFLSEDYLSDSTRCLRGGSYSLDGGLTIRSYDRQNRDPYDEYKTIGFRVASIPEPCTLSLLTLGAFLAGRRRRV